MKKVNLDIKFDEWKDKNEEDILSRWEVIKEDKLNEFIEELWREYQDEKGLIDSTNEIKE